MINNHSSKDELLEILSKQQIPEDLRGKKSQPENKIPDFVYAIMGLFGLNALYVTICVIVKNITMPFSILVIIALLIVTCVVVAKVIPEEYYD